VLNKIDDSVYTTLILVFIDLAVAFILLLGQKKKKTGRDADKSFKSFNTTANKLFVLIKQNLFTIVLSDKQILVQYQH